MLRGVVKRLLRRLERLRGSRGAPVQSAVSLGLEYVPKTRRPSLAFTHAPGNLDRNFLKLQSFTGAKFHELHWILRGQWAVAALALGGCRGVRTSIPPRRLWKIIDRFSFMCYGRHTGVFRSRTRYRGKTNNEVRL